MVYKLLDDIASPLISPSEEDLHRSFEKSVCHSFFFCSLNTFPCRWWTIHSVFHILKPRILIHLSYYISKYDVNRNTFKYRILIASTFANCVQKAIAYIFVLNSRKVKPTTKGDTHMTAYRHHSGRMRSDEHFEHQSYLKQTHRVNNRTKNASRSFVLFCSQNNAMHNVPVAVQQINAKRVRVYLSAGFVFIFI